MSALLGRDGSVLFVGEAGTKEALFDEWLECDALEVLNELLLTIGDLEHPDLIVVDDEI